MIPLIDCCNDVASKGDEIFDAIQTIGFVYLTNFGFDNAMVENGFNLGKMFFALPDDVKHNFAKAKQVYGGYSASGLEKLNSNSTLEIRESFDFNPSNSICRNMNEVVPGFYKDLSCLFEKCHELSTTILRIIAKHIKLDDCEFFTKCNTGESSTMLRLLHYPPLPQNLNAKAVRCGEHSDYCSVTLLFQDMVGGLEVKNNKREFVNATPIPNAVFIHTGDLMQRWTSNKIVAARHRVLLPQDTNLWTVERYAVAFFIHPANDFLVECLDGSKTYEPITALQYTMGEYVKTNY